MTVLLSGTLFQTLDLDKFLPRPCRQLNSTDDRRQFIPLSVHLCVQHYGRDAQRRAVRLRHLRLVGQKPTGWSENGPIAFLLPHLSA